MKEENLCQAFSDALLYKIEDIDIEDWENSELCSDYVKDIYQYLRQLEVLQSINPHFLDGRDINGCMCAILVDWLVQVHSKFRLLQETLYMCVAVMDRYLQVSPLWGLCAEEKTKGQFMRCQRTSSTREGGSSSMSHFQEC